MLVPAEPITVVAPDSLAELVGLVAMGETVAMEETERVRLGVAELIRVMPGRLEEALAPSTEEPDEPAPDAPAPDAPEPDEPEPDEPEPDEPEPDEPEPDEPEADEPE